MTTTRLKGRLHGQNGQIYVTSHGRRFLLAKCTPEITVYEKATQVNAQGVIGHLEKVVHCVIALCPNPEVFHEVNDDFIRSVTGVSLVFDAWDQQSVIEEITIDELTTNDLDYNGNWEFEAILPTPLAAKLLRYL